MKRKRESLGAKPRGPCPICHQGFDKATDQEFRHRWSYHLMFSERHKRYLALQTMPPPSNSEAPALGG